jgi:hypothetical protein
MEGKKMELRPLNTPEGICAELLYLAWQERAAARVERTNKQRTAEAEHAAQAMECLAADIDHVRKAFSVLKPHGVLVSVMAPGFEFRQDRKSTEFRAWLDEVGGTWEDLPDGAFKTSGSGISTRLVTIERAA